MPSKFISMTNLISFNSRFISKSWSPHTRRSSSSHRWTKRQSNDPFNREAKVRGLMSRAAFKLLEIDLKYRIFQKGQTVIDLGYAPGAWSQVAVDRTKPNGRIIGIDIIPAQPPRGVSTIQGNFLCPGVQAEIKSFLSQKNLGRPKSDLVFQDTSLDDELYSTLQETNQSHQQNSSIQDDMETRKKTHINDYRVVDIVLSDMCAPWPQFSGFWKKTLNDPCRMMNVSGIKPKDHLGSMELCHAALKFANDSLRVGGHFICKFYEGFADKDLQKKIKETFRIVNREIPEASRKESREAYFVARDFKIT